MALGSSFKDQGFLASRVVWGDGCHSVADLCYLGALSGAPVIRPEQQQTEGSGGDSIFGVPESQLKHRSDLIS